MVTPFVTQMTMHDRCVMEYDDICKIHRTTSLIEQLYSNFK